MEKGKAELMNVQTVANQNADTIHTNTAASISPPVSTPILAGEGEKISAPMPGVVLDIKVVQGATVKTGDVLVVLEAMKMENEILAPRDSVISEVSVVKGASVATDDPMVFIK